ncbi:hypothetical protein [uncultured Oscillibacter sp.]|nr:hypothetical protein [uncultured Oscillibacter sp.]
MPNGLLVSLDLNAQITHKFIERITVVDAGTIQVKIRDVDVVISEGLY